MRCNNCLRPRDPGSLFQSEKVCKDRDGNARKLTATTLLCAACKQALKAAGLDMREAMGR
jgi:hypothetical protein